MPTIEIVKPFSHVVTGDVHGTQFEPGIQDVDDRTAEVAVNEGWAVPFNQPEPEAKPEEAVIAGPQSPASGPAKPSSSQPRGHRKTGRRSTRSGGKPD